MKTTKPKAFETKMTRVWINQPSKLQSEHPYHGRNGLVNLSEKRPSKGGDIVRFWFVDGEEESANVFASSLSMGFNHNLKKSS